LHDLLIHFIPDPLKLSVLLFLKRQRVERAERDRTLGEGLLDRLEPGQTVVDLTTSLLGRADSGGSWGSRRTPWHPMENALGSSPDRETRLRESAI
jgi:hypothetical protein